VDVKITASGSVLVACLALWLANHPLPASAAPATGAVVEALTLKPSKDGVIVALKTSLPVPQFTCLLDKADSHQVVIDFPVATSRLKKRYALDSPLVRLALVEKLPEPGVALRIRLTLGEAALAAVVVAERGLDLRFQKDAPAPVAVPVPVPVPVPNPVTVPDAAAPPTEYLVGAGDKLDITVLGHADLDRVLEVRGDGTIDFPLVGEFPVAGKGLSQIGREMTRTLGSDYIVSPQVSVNIKEYGSQWVTVIGEVARPGRQLLKQKMRLIDILAEAGGFTAYANRKHIEILRPEGGDLRRKLMVNLKTIEDGKKPDVLLMSGDVVIVPRRSF
jgi:polysaccharide export outer membrane protein